MENWQAGLMGGAGGAIINNNLDFFKNPTPEFNAQMYADRSAEINTFASNLASARTKYLSSLNKMYNSAYSRFSGNAEAGFANRGLAVNGGAFASALAKKTAEFQAQLEPQAFSAERDDLGTVETLRDRLFGQMSGRRNALDDAKANWKNQLQAAVGGFAGKAGMAAMGGGMGGGGDFGSAGGPSGYGVEDSSSYPRTSFRGNPLDLRR